MGFYLSPSVNVVERDLSGYIPGVSTSIAGYVGKFTKGPVWKKTLITNERGLADLFGAPTDTNYEDFFSCAGYLEQGNTLWVTRVVDKAAALNAQIKATTSGAVSGAGVYVQYDGPGAILNASGNDFVPTFGGTDKVFFFAKYPGAYGNTDIKVGVISYNAWNQMATLPSSGWSAETRTVSAYQNVVNDPPTASDEFTTLVYTVEPDGITYSLAEQFRTSSTALKKNGNNENMYVDDYINSRSSYILAFNNTTLASSGIYSFAPILPTAGANGTTTDSHLISGYDLYANPEEFDVNILIGGGNTSVAVAQKIIAVCEARMDCIATLDTPSSDVVNIASISTAINNVLQYRQTELNPNTSYAAMYANWFQIRDRYNDKLRWVPSSGYVAGMYARTDNVSDPWFAPAGLNRAVFKSVIKLAINPDKGYRDILYKNGLNAIVSFPGQGIVIWGQKTLTSKPSSFDRINVRRLFIVLEKAISTAAKYMVFEQNDDFTRSIFKNMIVPFLKDVKGRRGIYDFFVDTSSTVNTPERVDRNEFWTEIYISPTKAAEFLVLRFNATKTGVNFEELFGAR